MRRIGLQSGHSGRTVGAGAAVNKSGPNLHFGDLGINQLAAMGSKPRKSAGFVLTHEAAVTGDIGGEDGREPALYTLPAQTVLPKR